MAAARNRPLPGSTAPVRRLRAARALPERPIATHVAREYSCTLTNEGQSGRTEKATLYSLDFSENASRFKYFNPHFLALDLKNILSD